jgi:hypothetical protein
MLHCAGGTGPQKSTLLLPLIRSCCPRSRHDVRRLRYTFRVGHSQPCRPALPPTVGGTTRRTRSLSSLPTRNGPWSPSVVRCGRCGRIPHVLRRLLQITARACVKEGQYCRSINTSRERGSTLHLTHSRGASRRPEDSVGTGASAQKPGVHTADVTSMHARHS